MTIATVFRSGGVYTAQWVQALWSGLRVFAPGSELRVLSDVPEVATDPLEHDWPGWWSKMELFRPGLFDGPVLYMDLDTLPVGDLSDLLSYAGDFACLEDFYNPGMIGSGVMAWTPGPHTEAVYETYEARPGFSGRMDRFLVEHIVADRIQDLYPGQVVSLKPLKGPRPIEHGPPDGARLVCGHGNPRLSDPKAGWGHETWRSRV